MTSYRREAATLADAPSISPRCRHNRHEEQEWDVCKHAELAAQDESGDGQVQYLARIHRIMY
jgi:hypothetical protein